MTSRHGRILVAVLSLVAASPAEAQSLASRVAAVRDGAVSFHFKVRDGVCGDGEDFIRTGRNSYHGNWSSHRGMEPCMPGPVQVRMTMENGVATRLQYWVGPLRDRSARDLGAVGATDAAELLLGIAARGTSRASSRAIFPAVLADSAVVWPALLSIAKDTETRSRATRNDAVFWLSRFAAVAAAGRPNDPFLEDHDSTSEDEDLKRHAIFVLSQLPRNEGVPQLIDVARTNPSWRVRSHALFWLGQSGDRRAIEVMEGMLRGRS